MTTVARWWAPAGPGIGPDETDLHLLAPGPDNEKDLGQAFLALHRVGAAACEAVATQPVADESVFASVLATARGLAVPEAFGIVSKAVGDEKYGHLLLRDVMDDAEAGAMNLYRSCLAASVPPPVAAQRVGLVFGVPPSEISPAFRKAATDPRTPPATLIDAGDRVLFGFVSKLLEAEQVQPTKEKVSKERVREQDKTQTSQLQGLFDQAERDYHGKEPGERDPETGEFVPKGRLAPVKAQQALKPLQALKPKQALRPERERTRSRDRSRTRDRERVARSREEAHRARRELTEHVLDDAPIVHRVTNRSRSLRSAGNVFELVDDDSGPYQSLGRKIAYAMPTDEFIAFRKAAADGDRGKVFRASHLERYIGDPEFFEEEDVTGVSPSEAHEGVVTHVVELLQKDPQIASQAAPKVKYIEASMLAEGDREEILLEAKSDFLAELGIHDYDELAHVDHGIDYENPEHVALVYVPFNGAQGKDVLRPLPNISEVIVDDEDAVGFDYAPPGSNHPQPHLAPNQPMTIIGSLHSDKTRRKFWDDNLQAFRTQWWAAPTDESEIPQQFQKAMTRERFQQLEQSGVIERDEDGQFSTTGKTLQQLFDEAQARPVETKTPLRAAKPLKAQAALAPTRSRERAGRTRTRERDTRTREASREGHQRAERRREVIERERRDGEGTQAMVLADGRYSVMDGDLLRLMASQDGKSRLFDSGQPWTLSSASRTRISEHKPIPATDAEDLAVAQAHDRFTFAPVTNKPAERPIDTYTGVTREQLAYLADDMAELFDTDSDLSLIRVSVTARPDGKADIKVEGNNRALGVQHVIRHAADLATPSLKLVQERAGRFQSNFTIQDFLERSFDSAQRFDSGVDVDQLANPWVLVWRTEEP